MARLHTQHQTRRVAISWFLAALYPICKLGCYETWPSAYTYTIPNRFLVRHPVTDTPKSSLGSSPQVGQHTMAADATNKRVIMAPINASQT